MADNIDPVQSLLAGLKGTSLRGRAIADNIANLNTPGYKRKAVEFEKALAKAMGGGKPGELKQFEPTVTTPLSTLVDAIGNDVELEGEIGDLLKNTMRQKVYLSLMKKIGGLKIMAMDTRA